VNLSAYEGASVRLGAITAPGQSDLPWNRAHCEPLGEHTCSGALGCRVDPDAAKAWNATASERWSRLNRTAYQRVQRELGIKPWVLTRVFEMQLRGVLHVHPVLAYGTYAERRAADRYLDLVDELGPHYGFGYSERKRRVMPALAAAAYLSAYFVTGKKESSRCRSRCWRRGCRARSSTCRSA
jgi:hypothetical protein